MISPQTWLAVQSALPDFQDAGNQLIEAGGAELFVAILRSAADHMERAKRGRGAWSEQRYAEAVAEVGETIADGARIARERES